MVVSAGVSDLTFFRSAGGPRPQRFASEERSGLSDALTVVHPLRPGTGRAPRLAASSRWVSALVWPVRQLN